MTGTTDAVLRAVRRELEQRRAHLDAATDLAEVTVTVSLNAGTDVVRNVTYSDHRIYTLNRRRGE